MIAPWVEVIFHPPLGHPDSPCSTAMTILSEVLQVNVEPLYIPTGLCVFITVPFVCEPLERSCDVYREVPCITVWIHEVDGSVLGRESYQPPVYAIPNYDNWVRSPYWR